MKKIFSLFLVFSFLFFSSCIKDDPNNPDNITLPDGFSSVSLTETGYSLTYGGSGNNDDELVSGMVADNSGNVYVSINITDASANKDVIVVRVSADGTLGWAQRYDGGKNDWSPDSGENAETGGAANSISMDSEGNLYVIMTTTQSSLSQSALILKISSTDGSIIWQKMWKPEWPTGTPTASQDNQGYGIDATGDYVYFTGATGTNKVIVCALNKSDGSIFFQSTLDIVPGTKDRGYAIKADNSGNLFVVGVDGSTGYFAKIIDANTSTPALAWVKNAGLSYAARINGIDIDASGVYFSCDIRGVETYFQTMKVDFDGNLQWAKIFPGHYEDRNNTHVVKLSGDYLYAGGRISEEELDKQHGDGLVVKMSKTDGSLVWSGIYYTGNNSEESAEHRVKGIAVVGDEVYVAGQVYGSVDNIDNFNGVWIENPDLTLQDASVSISAISTAVFELTPSGEVRDGEGSFSANTSVLQNATDKTTDNPPDGDAFMMKIKL
ncbi:MAG: hypothetical protein JXL97_07495 [Bacteroidales bacterium]|nr:hypothetical protein [Bacteroidales bacterium]